MLSSYEKKLWFVIGKRSTVTSLWNSSCGLTLTVSYYTLTMIFHLVSLLVFKKTVGIHIILPLIPEKIFDRPLNLGECWLYLMQSLLFQYSSKAACYKRVSVSHKSRLFFSFFLVLIERFPCINHSQFCSFLILAWQCLCLYMMAWTRATV